MKFIQRIFIFVDHKTRVFSWLCQFQGQYGEAGIDGPDGEVGKKVKCKRSH